MYESGDKGVKTPGSAANDAGAASEGGQRRLDHAVEEHALFGE